LERRRILVTGGTGLLGRELVRRLVTSGQRVRVISRTGVPAGHDLISMYHGDIRRLEDLRGAIRGCGAVFHCAAEKNDSARMTETNVSATRLLFDVASEAHVKFFLHLSSVGVVGRVRQRVVDESSPCSPTNRYEETKLAAERIVSAGLEGGKVMILRPTNIFGVQTILPWLRSTLYSRMRLVLQGNEHTHLVYIEDVAAAAIFLWQAGIEEPVETFNVSSDEEDGGTYRDAQALLASLIEAAPRPVKRSAPLFIPHGLRLIRRGFSNYGDVIYSSRKLREAGFHFPFGRRAGLVQVAGALQEQDSA